MPLQITPVRKWQLFTVVLLISNLLCAFAAFHFYRKVPEQFFQSERPSITDRNGNILVFSMTDPDRKTISYRHSASPESAAALIGYVTHAPYNDSGLSGIEKMIDEKNWGVMSGPHWILIFRRIWKNWCSTFQQMPPGSGMFMPRSSAPMVK